MIFILSRVYKIYNLHFYWNNDLAMVSNSSSAFVTILNSTLCDAFSSIFEFVFLMGLEDDKPLAVNLVLSHSSDEVPL